LQSHQNRSLDHCVTKKQLSLESSQQPIVRKLSFAFMRNAIFSKDIISFHTFLHFVNNVELKYSYLFRERERQSDRQRRRYRRTETEREVVERQWFVIDSDGVENCTTMYIMYVSVKFRRQIISKMWCCAGYGSVVKLKQNSDWESKRLKQNEDRVQRIGWLVGEEFAKLSVPKEGVVGM